MCWGLCNVSRHQRLFAQALCKHLCTSDIFASRHGRSLFCRDKLEKFCHARVKSVVQANSKKQTDLLHMCGAPSSPGTSVLLTLCKFTWKRSKYSSEKMKRRQMTCITSNQCLREVCFIYSMKQFTVLFIKMLLLCNTYLSKLSILSTL